MATTVGELANRHAGVIEAAIRKSAAPGMILRTVPARAQFEVQKLSEGALVLLFGNEENSYRNPLALPGERHAASRERRLDRNPVGP